MKTDIPALFLALRDCETPVWAKVFAGITVTCALSFSFEHIGLRMLN